MNKTASGLVKYCNAQLGKPYWYGCFGQKSSKALYEAKKRQYPHYYTANDFKNQYGKKVHDCIGLIKGYIWSKSETDGSPKYASNGCPDINEAGMYAVAKSKGAISTMPDVPGILVLMPNHIGVYIGDGYVIEARGHAYGVVKTKLKGRGWTKWCKCPYITYDTIKKADKPSADKKSDDKTCTVKTNGSVLNCRLKASKLSTKVGEFKNGTKLTLIKKGAKWHYVKGRAVSGKTIAGYVNAKWVKI